MKTHFLPLNSGRQGSTIVLTLTLLTVVLLIFSGIFKWSSMNAVQTLRNNQYNMSQSAAEGAGEAILGAMNRDFSQGSLADGSTYTNWPNQIDQSGWPVQYTFAVSNYLSPLSVSMVMLSGTFTNLYGRLQANEIYVTATPTNAAQSVPATVHLAQQFAKIPLFQYAVFYNIDMEIDPGSAMNIGGKVYCNASIWEGSGNATFADTVQAGVTNCVAPANNSKDPFCTNKTDTGTSHFTYSANYWPTDKNPKVTMPIGTNNDPITVRAILDIPPTNYALTSDAAYSTNGQVYPANQCDLFITNFPWGTNAWGTNTSSLIFPAGSNTIVYFQNGLSTTRMKPVPYDFVYLSNKVTHSNSPFSYASITNYVYTYPAGFTNNSTNTVIVYRGYSFVTNSVFFDWREGPGPAKRVEAVDIIVTNLTLWLKNADTNYGGKQFNDIKVQDCSHNIDGIYAYNAVPFVGVQLPAVRVSKGAMLPVLPYPTYSNCQKTNGLSVSTKFPLYVNGNYNSMSAGGSALGLYSTNSVSATTNTYGAALMADAITILSSGWSDTNTVKNPGGTAADTTVNAAMVEGIVSSTQPGNYSGGLENFLRLLENWNSGNPSGQRTLTYNGSICVLFNSQYATNTWNGNYYGIPVRHWAFDINFKDPNLLPPMTPMNKGLARLQWSTQ